VNDNSRKTHCKDNTFKRFSCIIFPVFSSTDTIADVAEGEFAENWMQLDKPITGLQ
jgi:hypothetical protein